MGNIRASNGVVLAKIETTYQTDAVPVVGTNAILVESVDFKTEGLTMNDRPAIRADIGQLQQVYGGALARLSFDVEVKGSGTAGTAPEHGTLLRACAMGETVVASTSVTYKPISSAHESATIYYFEGGVKKHVLTGCRGTVVLKLSARGIARYSFEFVGHVANPVDIAIPVPVYGTQVPKPTLSMAIAIGGISALTVRSWSVDLKNTIATPGSVSASDGFGAVIITKRDVSGEIELDAELASVIDLDTQLSAGTGLNFASGTLGSVAGNRFTATGATLGLFWRDRQFGAEDGLAKRTMPFGITQSATGNDEIALAYT